MSIGDVSNFKKSHLWPVLRKPVQKMIGPIVSVFPGPTGFLGQWTLLIRAGSLRQAWVVGHSRFAGGRPNLHS